MIRPDWPAPRAQALVTTAALGDIGADAGRSALRALLPGEPRWLHQVHGARVIDADRTTTLMQADAAVARARLQAKGVTRMYGGGFCTYSDARFFSYRRDRSQMRMAAAVWLT